MLTRGLVWAGLALFVYFLLTRLHTLAMLAATRRGLGEARATAGSDEPGCSVRRSAPLSPGPRSARRPFGIVTTLAIEAVGHELPVAGERLSETVGEATDEFELDERLARGGCALTWNELPTLLATVTGVAPVEPDQLILPPADMPIGARALGYWFGVFGVMIKARRVTQRTAMLARFDERANLGLSRALRAIGARGPCYAVAPRSLPLLTPAFRTPKTQKPRY